MSKPIAFFIQFQDTILSAYESSGARPKKTWDALENSLPKLARTMTFSTFKQYLGVFVALHAGLQSLFDRQLSELRCENEQRLRECAELRESLAVKDEEIRLSLSGSSGLSRKIHELAEEYAIMQAKIATLATELPVPESPSRNIAGWTVRLTAKGYYHLCKSFSGSVKTIYLGKVLDEQKAREKIAAYMSKLG
ncbi:MAG: hypothetical protein HN580_26435 [Deltaproteobacteria bacterium]|jgi:hypothetical protein|nr:hypothetical protein [Deltaproteobacteria bacterium]